MALPEAPSRAPSETQAEPASSGQVGESAREAARAADSASRLRVTVVFAEAERVRSVDLDLPSGATLAAAAQTSGLWHPASGLDLGVWGHRLPGDTELADGDRVEIYRALLIDPKEARRHRVELRRTRKPRG